MITRRAQISDFLKISELDRIAWSGNRNSEFIPDGEHIWRFWVEYSSVFVALQNNQLIGAVISFRANVANLQMLHKLFVHVDYRNRKVGSKLLGLLCEELDAMKVDCFTTVDPANSSMLKVCNKFGFINSTLIESYYRAKEDRFFLKREASASKL